VAHLDVHAADRPADDLTDGGDPLRALRAAIDDVDDAVVRALVERFRLSLAAASHKDTVHDPAREATILDHVERLARELGGPAADIRQLYAGILEVSRGLQAAQAGEALTGRPPPGGRSVHEKLENGSGPT
jgi:chorismate mutase